MITLTIPTRFDRAMRLRDMALKLLDLRGITKSSGAGTRETTTILFSTDRLVLLLSSKSLLGLHNAVDAERNDLIAPVDGFEGVPGLFFELDIWAPKKVLNFEWTSDRHFRLRSFRRGAWEDDLESLDQLNCQSDTCVS
jgi:hypothetical protein